jgi:pantoate--beta-alanine ligase
VDVTGGRHGFRKACDAARLEGRSVGFVPTMGSLHTGHGSLLGRAREECGLVAVSIFVNPLQFGPGEDLAGYPRDLDHDLAECERAGVDLVFEPGTDEMYPAGSPEVTVDPGPLGDRLEGASRPGHFRGVCTVVAKLLGLVGPCRVYFGEKDAQQLAVIRRMARDLDLPVEVVGCPTVREPDGLALSSRNAYLSLEERAAASCLYEALARAAWLVEGGEGDAHALKAEMARRIGMEPLARLDYVAVVDEGTFEELDRLRGPSRALVAARFGPARLIDNMPLRMDKVGDNPPED